MKCTKCSNNISDLQLIKSLSQGKTNCSKCDAELIVREKGMGLAMNASLLGAGIAAVSLFLTTILDTSIWVDLAILLAAVFITLRYAIKIGIELKS